MKKFYVLMMLSAMSWCVLSVFAARYAGAQQCVSCHDFRTPGIAKQWRQSKHFDNSVHCENCHLAKEGDPSGYYHNGFTVTAVPSPKYCEECHARAVEENSKSKHAWATFLGPLKPYYLKAKADGLDPFSQETAKQLDPEKMAKTALTPLFPDSGILARIRLLDDPTYHHNNVNLGCIQCHGSFVIAEPDGVLKGWPNTGVGRVNPDGSLGSCTACHTRHTFSVEEARPVASAISGRTTRSMKSTKNQSMATFTVRAAKNGSGIHQRISGAPMISVLLRVRRATSFSRKNRCRSGRGPMRSIWSVRECPMRTRPIAAGRK
jgi:hypothetical protein